jgi:hypothetical protein
MSVPWDKTFLWLLTDITLTLVFDWHIENFNVGYDLNSMYEDLEMRIWCIKIGIVLVLHIPYDCSLRHDIPMVIIIFRDNTTVMEQMIWRCDLSIG